MASSCGGHFQTQQGRAFGHLIAWNKQQLGHGSGGW
jgi:hypothetical protein